VNVQLGAGICQGPRAFLPSPAFQALSGEFLPPPFSMRLWLSRANSVCSRGVFLHTSRHSDWCVFWNLRVWWS